MQCHGTVRGGMHRGRRLGFPTLNIAVPKWLTPELYGVYCSVVTIGTQRYPAVTHVGPPKTFGQCRPTCESHVLAGVRVGPVAVITIDFLVRLRDVYSFPTAAALRTRIKKDLSMAHTFFNL